MDFFCNHDQSSPYYQQISFNVCSMTAFTHFIKLIKSCCCSDDGYELKTSMHTPSVKADLSDSMKMIVQLPKKSMIQICCVWKKIKGWQIADSPTKLMTPISNWLYFLNFKFILLARWLQIQLLSFENLNGTPPSMTCSGWFKPELAVTVPPLS